MKWFVPIWLGVFLALSVLSACAELSTRGSWKETGRSWGEGGRQFLRALGRSISGEGSPKEEWTKTGQELREAGKSTADSVGKTLDAEAPANKESPE